MRLVEAQWRLVEAWMRLVEARMRLVEAQWRFVEARMRLVEARPQKRIRTIRVCCWEVSPITPMLENAFECANIVLPSRGNKHYSMLFSTPILDFRKPLLSIYCRRCNLQQDLEPNYEFAPIILFQMDKVPHISIFMTLSSRYLS